MIFEKSYGKLFTLRASRLGSRRLDAREVDVPSSRRLDGNGFGEGANQREREREKERTDTETRKWRKRKRRGKTR